MRYLAAQYEYFYVITAKKPLLLPHRVIGPFISNSARSDANFHSLRWHV